jgi:hypothetical protein
MTCVDFAIIAAVPSTRAGYCILKQFDSIALPLVRATAALTRRGRFLRGLLIVALLAIFPGFLWPTGKIAMEGERTNDAVECKGDRWKVSHCAGAPFRKPDSER